MIKTYQSMLTDKIRYDIIISKFIRKEVLQMSTTRKKVKVIGTETYIKQSTGEIEEMQVMKIEERDANFHKLWLEHILHDGSDRQPKDQVSVLVAR